MGEGLGRGNPGSWGRESAGRRQQGGILTAEPSAKPGLSRLCLGPPSALMRPAPAQVLTARSWPLQAVMSQPLGWGGGGWQPLCDPLPQLLWNVPWWLWLPLGEEQRPTCALPAPL